MVGLFSGFFPFLLMHKKERRKQPFNEIRVEFKKKEQLTQDLLKADFMYPWNRESANVKD